MLLASPGVCCAAQEENPLNLKLFPVPLQRRDLPLSRALSEVGVRLQGGYVLFGVDVELIRGSEPTINLDVPPGLTLGEALKQILEQVPGYEFHVVSSHIVNVCPQGSREDTHNLLNLRVERFDLDNEAPDDVLSRPADFIPALKAALTPPTEGRPVPRSWSGPGLTSIGPVIRLHLRDVTLREILNSVSDAMRDFPPELSPSGWVHRFEPDSQLPTGAKHSWGGLWTVPSDWKAGPPKKPRRND
jgi:hypothetical protein